ncbi:MAG TPA: winged helix-turn-helix domain-containing protein [Sphingopyxis sp.]|nr:winged helix-turn-helix domain-containing protein [Sphingopyxis sp.]HMP46370.1 winged helix-turn-helix domain-containing protein [Sphingopyxis sp.]HMQ19912.1 winged helix-turn-helix domain-containing protein [Sphingopyxis sp.]
MNGKVMRFGQVEFDPAHRRLTVAGRRVALDPPCAAILSVLLDEAGGDVDKDRLLEAGWPDRLVHENSLAKAIGRLRHALGDDGRALETVHGRGYRLAVEPHAVASAPSAPPRARRRRRPALVAAALVLLAAAVGLGRFLYGGADSGMEDLRRGEPADAIGRLLWVDDHPENNLKEKRFFEGRKIAVYQVTASEEVPPLLAMYEYRAVISDMNRHGRPLAGLELVREMRRLGDDTPFFLYTVVPSAAQRQLVAEAGGQGVAVTSEELYATVLPLFARKKRLAGNAGARLASEEVTEP